MPNLDFTYLPEPQPDHTPQHKVTLGTINLAQPAIDAAKLAHQIMQTDQAGWKDAIGNAPEPLQERLKTILRREWTERAARKERAANQQRRACGAHQTPAGDAALAAISTKLGMRK